MPRSIILITLDGRAAGVGKGVGTAIAIVVEMALPPMAVTMEATSRMANHILFTAGDTTPLGLYGMR